MYTFSEKCKNIIVFQNIVSPILLHPQKRCLSIFLILIVIITITTLYNYSVYNTPIYYITLSQKIRKIQIKMVRYILKPSHPRNALSQLRLRFVIMLVDGEDHQILPTIIILLLKVL